MGHTLSHMKTVYAIFILTDDRSVMLQTEVMKMPHGIYIVKKSYRLSRLMPEKSCATSLISLTPNAVWTEFSSSSFAASQT